MFLGSSSSSSSSSSLGRAQPISSPISLRRPTARKSTRKTVTKSAVGGGGGGKSSGHGKGGGNGGNNDGDDGKKEGDDDGSRRTPPITKFLLTTFAASYAPHALAGKKSAAGERKLGDFTDEANKFIAGLDFTEFAELFTKEFGISVAVGVGVGVAAKLAAKTALMLLASVYALLRWLAGSSRPFTHSRTTLSRRPPPAARRLHSRGLFQSFKPLCRHHHCLRVDLYDPRVYVPHSMIKNKRLFLRRAANTVA